MGRANYAAWEVTPEAFPRDGTLAEQARHLLRYAVLAPSGHNAQPWAFAVSPAGEIAVYADRSRQLEIADPTGRELYASLGAALKAITLAAEYFEFDFTLALFPDGQEDDRVATVTLSPGGVCSATTGRLFPYLPRRRSAHGVMAEGDLAEDIRQAVRAGLTDVLEVEFELISEAQAKIAVAEWVGMAERELMDLKEYRQELAAWVRPNGTDAFDGMLARGFHVGDFASHFAAMAVRGADPKQAGRVAEYHALNAPLLVVLGTHGNARPDWVFAGGAALHLGLLVTPYHLSVGYLSGVIAHEGYRRSLQERLYDESIVPHLLLRVGYALPQPGSPRRLLDQVLR